MPAKVAEMAKKKPEATEPSDYTTDVVRIESDLAEMLRLMARRRKVGVAEILSPLARKQIEEEFAKFVAEINRISAKDGK